MTVISEDRRIDALRELVSASLVRISAGELLHPLFRGVCQGPPFYVYHKASVPNGPLLLPLWDHADFVVGVWQRSDGLEFLRFSIETPEEYESLASTEQGFWARQFVFFIECECSSEQLASAANAVGFLHLPLCEDEYRLMEEQADHTFEKHRQWLGSLVERVEGLSRVG